MKLWQAAWPEFVPFLAYSPEIREVIYSTNAIESLHARFRRSVRARGHFPSEQAAMKCLYGKRIAFVAQRLNSGVTDIWTVNADGTNDQPLTYSSSSNLGPSWSPDGARIICEKDEFYGHDIDLYSIDANGGTENLLRGSTGRRKPRRWLRRHRALAPADPDACGVPKLASCLQIGDFSRRAPSFGTHTPVRPSLHSVWLYRFDVTWQRA